MKIGTYTSFKIEIEVKNKTKYIYIIDKETRYLLCKIKKMLLNGTYKDCLIQVKKHFLPKILQNNNLFYAAICSELFFSYTKEVEPKPRYWFSMYSKGNINSLFI